MLSVQSFCLKEELGVDLQGTVRQLYEIGYDSFEPLLVFDEKQGKKPANLFSFERMAQLKPILDSYGMTIPTAHAGIGYETLKDRIVHVHLKDVALVNAKPSLFEPEMAADGRLMRGAVFGNGVIPVKEIYERMHVDGYSGTFAIEYIRPKADCCSLQEHKSHLKLYVLHLMG